MKIIQFFIVISFQIISVWIQNLLYLSYLCNNSEWKWNCYTTTKFSSNSIFLLVRHSGSNHMNDGQIKGWLNLFFVIAVYQQQHSVFHILATFSPFSHQIWALLAGLAAQNLASRPNSVIILSLFEIYKLSIQFLEKL